MTEIFNLGLKKKKKKVLHFNEYLSSEDNLEGAQYDLSVTAI